MVKYRVLKSRKIKFVFEIDSAGKFKARQKGQRSGHYLSVAVLPVIRIEHRNSVHTTINPDRWGDVSGLKPAILQDQNLYPNRFF